MRPKSYLFVLQEFLVLSRKLKALLIFKTGLTDNLDTQERAVTFILNKQKNVFDYGQTQWFCGSFPEGLSQLVQQNLRPCPTASLLKRAIKTHCMHFPFCLTFQLPCQCVFTPGIFNHSHTGLHYHFSSSFIYANRSKNSEPLIQPVCNGDSSFVSSNWPDQSVFSIE